MLRGLFEREVDYLWSRLARAAEDREALAPLWSRDGDARVARLVESAAYVFARVKEKLVDDVPEISHALVAGALPEVLRPTPSATILHFGDAHRARRNVVLQRAQQVESRPIDDAPCVFETCWPVTTAPIVLARAALTMRESGVQALTLRLEAYPGLPLARAVPEPLRVFAETADPVRALDVVRALTASTAPPVLRALDAAGGVLSEGRAEGVGLAWTALDPARRITPGPSDRFASSTALRTLFAFPEAFGFFDITGLPASLSSFDDRLHALEITIRLERPVSEASSNVLFHLDCAPAVNVFEARAAPIEVRRLGSSGALRVSGHPSCEVLDVRAVRLIPDRDPDHPLAVRLWERLDQPRAYRDGELYLRFERRAAIDAGPTELRATLLRPSGVEGIPRGQLHAELLATDGRRTESLLRGDITRSDDTLQLRNLSRVTPPHSAALDQRLPWRLNAYARMPVADLARAASLAAFLDLHALSSRGPSSRMLSSSRRALQSREGRQARSADEARGSDPARAGVLGVSRVSATRVVVGEVHHGDRIDVQLDEPTFGGPGATWLVGELLARAMAERGDLLRYTRTRRVGPSGAVEADYGVRGGQRLPPPFG